MIPWSLHGRIWLSLLVAIVVHGAAIWFFSAIRGWTNASYFSPHEIFETIAKHVPDENTDPLLADLAGRLDLDIVAMTPSGIFSSKEDLPSFEELYQAAPMEYAKEDIPLVHRDDQAWMFFRLSQELVILVRPKPDPYTYFLTRSAFVPTVFSLIMLSGMYVVIFWLIRPLKPIRDSMHRFRQGNLNHRIQVTAGGELGSLANLINSMAESLEHSLQSLRQAMLGVSHEMRTPMTRIAMYLERLPAEETRDKIQRNLEELNSLLLALVDSEDSSIRNALNRFDTVDLVEIVDSVVHEFDQLLLNKESISWDRPKYTVPVRADPLRSRFAIRSLIRNSLSHGGGEATITATRHGQVVVADNGAGYTPEALEHSSKGPHERQKTGYLQRGIGLYICRLIAEAQGGGLELRNQKDRGSISALFLPTVTELPAPVARYREKEGQKL